MPSQSPNRRYTSVCPSGSKTEIELTKKAFQNLVADYNNAAIKNQDSFDWFAVQNQPPIPLVTSYAYYLIQHLATTQHIPICIDNKLITLV